MEIVTPGRIVFNEEVKSFSASGIEGSFQILPNHAPFITTIIPGQVKFVSKSNDTDYYVTSGGTVEVHDNKITMLAESIIPVGSINAKEAEEEFNNAKSLLDSKEPGIDKAAAKHRLLTAKAKLKAIAN